MKPISSSRRQAEKLTNGEGHSVPLRQTPKVHASLQAIQVAEVDRQHAREDGGGVVAQRVADLGGHLQRGVARGDGVVVASEERA